MPTEKQISRKAQTEQPARMLDELGDAYAVVRENAAFSKAIAAGTLTFYGSRCRPSALTPMGAASSTSA